MKIAVIGCGYLGAVHAASMAKLGHEVVGIDVDAAKIARLAKGEAPFHEPGLDAILHEEVRAGRLSFSTEVREVEEASIIFLGVGTPQRADSPAADLRFIEAAIDSLLPMLRAGMLVAGKSTVPVGTARRLLERVRATGASLMWNPEFLREGFAVNDTLHPDRIVYGLRGGSAAETAQGIADAALLDEAYARILAEDVPKLQVDLETAELVKVAANSFLATKISFINAMAEVCEAVGADVTALADAIGLDDRIGRRFLNAGLGFGGGCLPKDIRAFRARTQELGLESMAFLDDVDAINLRRRAHVVDLAVLAIGNADAPQPLSGQRIAVLGLSFKPDSDDLRDSPALDVARHLAAEGAEVRAFDPAGGANARRVVGEEVNVVDSIEDALQGAELVVLGTEWPEFRALDPARAATFVSAPRIIDGRNALDRAAWEREGWTYQGLGRP